MYFYDRYVREKVEFRVPNLNSKQKNVLYFITRKIIEPYQRYDEADQFERLKLIIWTRNKTDFPCINAIGCCDWENVYSLYYDDSRFDSFIMSMELAHFALEQICRNSFDKRTRDHSLLYANDLIHRAANGMEPHYIEKKVVKYKEPFTWSLSRKTIPITTFTYNLKNLYNDRFRLVAEIASGKAPKGTNPYWQGIENSSAKSEVLQWLNHYHIEDQVNHNHDDHGH